MLQRETQPGQVLDPRLVAMTDQCGMAWYHDSVAGTILRGPRYYDGVRGGILAEQMGAGKTVICLSLILATRHQPAETPDIYHGSNIPVRRRIGSLVDMAAASLTRQSFPWGLYFDAYQSQGLDYDRCANAIRRNPGSYWLPRPEARRQSRQPLAHLPPTRIFLSRASLVIVPTNLVQQWKQEITKHTSGLKALILVNKQIVPPAKELLEYDIVLLSIARFEQSEARPSPGSQRHLDARVSNSSRPLQARDSGRGPQAWQLQDRKEEQHPPRTRVYSGICALDRDWNTLDRSVRRRRFGARDTCGETTDVDAGDVSADTPPRSQLHETSATNPGSGSGKKLTESSFKQERDDLSRIGSMARLYLKARPWANTVTEDGDTPAEWEVYIMQPRHSSKSYGREDCLRRDAQHSDHPAPSL